MNRPSIAIDLPERRRESSWVAIVAREDETNGQRRASDVVVARARDRMLLLRGDPPGRVPEYAAEGSVAVVFDGFLESSAALVSDPEPRPPGPSDHARRIVAAYRRNGEAFLGALRGTFAFVLWDLADDVLLCVRDPMGLHPLFYAEAAGGLVISDSIDATLAVPGVSPRPHRAAVAMHIASLPIRRDLTFFESIRRVLPGNVLRCVNGTRATSRYWDPSPVGKPIDWVQEDEVDRFMALFDQAIERCQTRGPTGIFLSGGLDSGSIAAVAVANGRRLGMEPPVAFSLFFPVPECNEEEIQRAVAANLGLEQVGLGFDEALGNGGLLAPALEISSRLPAPLDNFWLPAYYTLGQMARRRGCRRVLTGIGGDEWLSVTPTLAADLVLALDVPGLYRLWRMIAASYKLPKARMAWNLFWTNCTRPLLGEAGALALGRFAPRLLQAKRRALRRIPGWFVADPSLREEIEATLEPPVTASEMGGFYVRDLRVPLDHYMVSMEFEEDFEVARRGGVERLYPFLDADLLDFLYRTPPTLLNRGGRAKGLVRGMMAERFPGLGFESQRKVGATNFIESRLFAESRSCWDAMGERLALADLGVIDAERWRLTLRDILEQSRSKQLHFVWLVLTMESWLRARY
jgi:asparagine synthase (glutamine-hydrolysing)